jgi:hypothetical protein
MVNSRVLLLSVLIVTVRCNSTDSANKVVGRRSERKSCALEQDGQKNPQHKMDKRSTPWLVYSAVYVCTPEDKRPIPTARLPASRSPSYGRLAGRAVKLYTAPVDIVYKHVVLCFDSRMSVPEASALCFSYRPHGYNCCSDFSDLLSLVADQPGLL